MSCDPLDRLDIKDELNFSKLHSPKMKSVYWRHFGFPTNDDDRIITKRSVVCTICHKVLTNHGNTTNLRAHLQHRHKEIFKKICLENDIKVPPRKPHFKTTTTHSLRTINLKSDSSQRKIKREYIDCVQNDSSPIGRGEEEEQAMLYETMVPMTYDDDEIIDADHFAKVEVGGGVIHSTDNNNKIGTEVDALCVEGGDAESGRKHSYNLDVIEEIEPYHVQDGIVNMIIQDISNVNVISDPGLSQLIRTFGIHSSSIPNQEKIETMLREMHADKLTVLTDEIKIHSQIKPFSLGFEIWENIDKKNFLSIYYNYTTEAPKYNLINRLFTTLEYNKYLSIEAVFEDFNLNNCTVAIVSYEYDDYLKQFLNQRNIPIILSYDAIVDKCLLNVFALPEVAPVLEEVKDVIMHYTTDIISKNVDIPIVHDDFPWTNYELLKFFCENVSWPDEVEMLVNNAKLIVEVLNTLALTLETLKGEEIPHSSMLSPMTTRMLNNKLAVNERDDELTALIKSTINTELARLVISDDNLTISGLLDPRFHRLTHVTNLSNCLEILSKKYKAIVETDGGALSIKSQTNADKSTPAGSSKKSNLELFFDIQDSGETVAENESSNVESDLKRYRQEVYVSLDESPFLWWSKLGHMYGTLKHLALLYQCVPCVVNMNFKKPVNEQMHEHRKRFMLSGTLIDAILFLHFNSKNENYHGVS